LSRASGYQRPIIINIHLTIARLIGGRINWRNGSISSACSLLLANDIDLARGFAISTPHFFLVFGNARFSRLATLIVIAPPILDPPSLTVMTEGRGAPVKCSMTSQLDFLIGGVCGVLGVLGVCGCEDGVMTLEPGGSNSSSMRGLPPSLPLLTCCLRLAHLLVLLTPAPAIILGPISPWNKVRRFMKARLAGTDTCRVSFRVRQVSF